ncbi:hypothetical protein J5226_19780 [Lysobacter sp. K5869]|uniref:hypothetical protein n=1 Tax=Lysobacter sp. K5869 TaxID=2820808 RepID=UPI001C061174|nr:hypothetical protein [Lysobacter sp. K5869]QWP75826.1 hypothetical protein J5226_19780 [Lysobacter sp. K5869]
MTFAHRSLAVAVFAGCLLSSACAGKPVVDQRPDASPCLPGSAQCAIYDFAMADEIVLRANGEAIRVDCPESPADAPLQERQARCAALMEVALSLVSSRIPDALGPIAPESVRYEPAAGCADAGAACAGRLQAKVPLPWVVTLPGQAPAADAGTR